MINLCSAEEKNAIIWLYPHLYKFTSSSGWFGFRMFVYRQVQNFIKKRTMTGIAVFCRYEYILNLIGQKNRIDIINSVNDIIYFIKMLSVLSRQVWKLSVVIWSFITVITQFGRCDVVLVVFVQFCGSVLYRRFVSLWPSWF